jgi:hypothetical protein
MCATCSAHLILDLITLTIFDEYKLQIPHYAVFSILLLLLLSWVQIFLSTLFTQSHDSTVSIAMGYGLDDWGSRVRFLAGAGNFSLHHCIKNGSMPTQPPIQRVLGALSLAVKRPGCEADHSPPSTAKVKNAWSYTSTPPIHLHGVVLSKEQGHLYLLTFTLFTHILHLYFSFRVRDQVSHPYKAGKHSFVYTLNFPFFDTCYEDKRRFPINKNYIPTLYFHT